MLIIGIIMAFDFGINNIGIAIGQILTCTTQPLNVCKSKSGVPDWKNIEHTYNEWNPIKLIVGLPLKMNGNEQTITILSKKFAKQLQKKFNIPVDMHDERFSTVEARSKFLKYSKNNLLKSKKTYEINSIAAEIILKSWLSQTLLFKKK